MLYIRYTYAIHMLCIYTHRYACLYLHSSLHHPQLARGRVKLRHHLDRRRGPPLGLRARSFGQLTRAFRAPFLRLAFRCGGRSKGGIGLRVRVNPNPLMEPLR